MADCFAIFWLIMKKKREKTQITVGFIALGCPKNTIDSEKMLAKIGQAGMVITSEPEQADVIVVNTCGFIEPAKQEALEEIKFTVDCKGKKKTKKVIVTGCLAQRMGKDLFDEIDGIDAIVGLGQRDNIAGIIKDTLGAKQAGLYLEHCEDSEMDDSTRLLITRAHSAYLRISEGCDHKCTFCTIPTIRGRFRSKPEYLILIEAEQLSQAGVVELNVIAQDTAYYGKDIGIKDGLAELAKKLEKINGIEWIRLMYLYPIGITEKLIQTVAESKKILNYFDMPIQHINDDILKNMGRPDRKEKICSLIKNLKSKISDIALRTTVIVGFPGETDEQFGELLEFIKWARFDALGCFPYYPEEGTEAASMPGQISDKIKNERIEELMLAQQEIVFEKDKQKISREFVCLVDHEDQDGKIWGRSYAQAMDIDSLCLIEKCSAKPGEFVKVKTIGTKDYDLIVEQI